MERTGGQLLTAKYCLLLPKADAGALASLKALLLHVRPSCLSAGAAAALTAESHPPPTSTADEWLMKSMSGHSAYCLVLRLRMTCDPGGQGVPCMHVGGCSDNPMHVFHPW